MRILICEERRVSDLLYSAFLEKGGHTVKCLPSVEDVLDLFDQGDTHWDVLITGYWFTLSNGERADLDGANLLAYVIEERFPIRHKILYTGLDLDSTEVQELRKLLGSQFCYFHKGEFPLLNNYVIQLARIEAPSSSHDRKKSGLH